MASNVKKTRTVSAANLTACSEAALVAGKATADVAKAVAKALGRNPDMAMFTQVRGATIAGYLAATLSCTIEKATAIMASVGHGAKTKAKAGQGRRTKAQETAYASARKMWSRMIDGAGITSPEARGGDNGGGKASAKAKAKRQANAGTGKAKVVPAEEIGGSASDEMDRATALAYFQQTAATMFNKVEKVNQHLMAVEDKTLPIEVCSLIADFRDALNKAIAKAK